MAEQVLSSQDNSFLIKDAGSNPVCPTNIIYEIISGDSSSVGRALILTSLYIIG